MSLSTSQKEAVEKFKLFLFDNSKLTMGLIGRPGFGKTYVIKHMIDEVTPNMDLYSNLYDSKLTELNLVYSATTHRATEVLSESTGSKVKTIHSVLGLKPVTIKGSSSLKEIKDLNLSRYTVLIIDESSQVTKELFSYIQKGIRERNLKVLFVGDKYQLKGIDDSDPDGEFDVFEHLDVKAELTESQRYGSGAIYDFGTQICETIDTGVFKPIITDNNQIIKASSVEFKERIDSITDDCNKKILCWTNATAIKYNNYVLNNIYGTTQPLKGQVYVSNKIHEKLGRPIILNEQRVVINDTRPDEIINGVDCYVIQVHIGRFCEWGYLPKDPAKLITATRSILNSARRGDIPWSQYYKFIGSFMDIRPKYASTTFKAQGGSYDEVYVNLPDIAKCDDPDTVARMLNVSITRAKNRVYLNGDLPKKYGGIYVP